MIEYLLKFNLGYIYSKLFVCYYVAKEASNSMTKNEFLDVLRQSLVGEVSPEVIEQNIRYYDQYLVASSPEKLENLFIELGDPRLIAKSIIESNRAAKQKGGYGSYQSDYSSINYDSQNENQGHSSSQHKKSFLFASTTWYQKITIALSIILTVIILIFLGRIMIGLLFTIGIPIILLLFVMSLFRKR